MTISRTVRAAMDRNRFGPQWRWIVAQDAARQSSRKLPAAMDQFAQAAAAYLRKKHGRSFDHSQEGSFQAVAAAEAMQGDTGVRETMQILTCGRVDIQDIAVTMGRAIEEVRLWELLFFDIRDILDRPGWVRAKVMQPLDERGLTTFTSRLKVAMAGGPSVAQLLIESDVRIPTDEADQIADAQLRLHRKLIEASDFPIVCSEDAVRLLTAQMEHTLAMKELEFQREQFRESCEAARREHELSLRQTNQSEVSTADATEVRPDDD
ncbi:MAG: hypothetical protein QGG71_26560 [Pirellulaceae bacterium]|nr:hypothetical protein [Pirellulaceae bacterium]